MRGEYKTDSMNRPPYVDHIPERVRVLIIGGGIHGLGVLHDMASRGWQDVFLIEKSTLGSGTSSKSTKLIHGGLRYLERIRDFGLVSEALHERSLLLKLAPDLVRPLELIFPILKKGGAPGFYIRAGLGLYDFLAGRANVHKHRKIPKEEALAKAPILDESKFSQFFSFWDGQTDDLAMARRVAESSALLGGRISEHTRAVKMWPTENGWNVEIQTPQGELRTIGAMYIFNACGPWAGEFLSASQITDSVRGVNNRGSHIVTGDLGLKSALFLQSPEDGRIFFVIPWLGSTLIGTTEELHDTGADDVHATDQEISYLLENTNRYLKQKITENMIQTTYAGLRWLAIERGQSLSKTSRSHVITEMSAARGLCLTLYGGKYSTYRSLAREVGDRIVKHFGDFIPSQTHRSESWIKPSESSVFTSTHALERLGLDIPARRFKKAQ